MKTPDYEKVLDFVIEKGIAFGFDLRVLISVAVNEPFECACF